MSFSPIKAEIRKRYGSIKAFEKAKGLRPFAVRDHLGGRSVGAAEQAILREFGPHELEQSRVKSRRVNLDDIEQRLAAATAMLHALTEEVERLRAAR